jgi:hypothetical protein
MATVTGTINVNTSTQQAGAATIPGNVTALTVNQSFRLNFAASGTAADKVDLKHTKTYTLAAAATTIDLTALADVYGGTVNFARVRSITIRIKTTTDGQTLVLSGGASNPWTALINSAGTLTLQAGTANNDAVFVISAPNTTGWVTSGTSKTLKFDPGASTYDIEVEIMGASV